MRSPRLREHPALHALGLVLAGACLLPLAWLAFVASADRAAIGEALRTASTLPVILRSLALAAGLGIGCAVLSLGIAWLTHATDLPARRFFRIALVLPLAVPSYVTGFVVVALFGPVGLWTEFATGIGLPAPPEVQGLFGVVLALAPAYPLALLPLGAALTRIDPAQWEAARSLGASPGRAFRQVILPQLRAPSAAGALLVALYVLSDFGAVSLLRYPTLSYLVYLRYKTPFARDEAAVFALILAAAALLLMAAYAFARGRSYALRGVARRWQPIALGAWRWPAAIGCSLVVAYGIIVPLLVVAWWLVRGVLAGNPVGAVLPATATSLGLGLAAAAVIVGLSLAPALLSRFGEPRISAWVRTASQAGYALPGIVVAIALVSLGVRWMPALYQTTGLLLIAYTIRFLPLAVETVSDGLGRQSPRLHDAARSLGCSAQRAWWRVDLPASLPMLVAAGLAVFISVIKELPATVLLAPPGTVTLATRIWSLTADAYFTAAAAPVLVLLALAIAAVLLTPDAHRRNAS